MDPDAALAAIRKAVRELNKVRDGATIADLDQLDYLIYEFVEHVEALDEWITKGGFLPAAWAH